MTTRTVLGCLTAVLLVTTQAGCVICCRDKSGKWSLAGAWPSPNALETGLTTDDEASSTEEEPALERAPDDGDDQLFLTTSTID